MSEAVFPMKGWICGMGAVDLQVRADMFALALTVARCAFA
jgi:hypothetical protein